MSERETAPPLGKGAKLAVSIAVVAIVGVTGYLMFQKTPDDVVEEHCAAANAKLEAFRARMDEARSLAPLTEDTLVAPAERVDIGKEGNGALVHVLRLEESPPDAEVLTSCFLSVPIHEKIQSHLSGAGLSSSVADAEALFARFDRVRYRLVVVERACLPPTVSVTTKTYTPGTMRGDAHLLFQGRPHLGARRSRRRRPRRSHGGSLSTARAEPGAKDGVPLARALLTRLAQAVHTGPRRWDEPFTRLPARQHRCFATPRGP